MSAAAQERLPLPGAGRAGRRLRRDGGHRGWLLAAALCALPALVPLGVVLASLLTPDLAIWEHLLRHVLPGVLRNTLVLVAGVALLAALLGVAHAWLTALCEFPGRRFFDWALLLPLAVPGYVLAFVYVGALRHGGPVHEMLRAVRGADAGMPDVRSAAGVTLVLALTLYPYVYMLARSAFLTQGRRAIEAARSLGMSQRRAAWHVALPLARPWIAAGTALVAMETLADFGTVAVFNYDTFTTAIYRAWFGLFSVGAALELSAVLMLLVLLALLLERSSRRRARFVAEHGGAGPAARIALGPLARWGAFAAALATLLAAFVLPVAQLGAWAWQHAGSDLDARYAGFALRSLALAALAVLLIVGSAVVLAYAVRLRSGPLGRGIARVATLGYAVPGTVLAVGIVVSLATLNNALQTLLDALLGTQAPALLLHGSVLAVLLAYAARFMAVGFGPVDSAFGRITRSLDEAAMSLGASPGARLRRLHLPLLRSGLLAGAVLVFIDVMKEMPITLITRPFGWDTLAVRVFEMTSEGQWERAALPALAIVLVALLPVALLTRRGPHAA